MKKEDCYVILQRLFWILLGQFISACSFCLILVPNGLVATGFGGISTVLNKMFGFNMQVVLIILCIPVFVWSFFCYEKKQVLYALFSYGVFTIYVGFIPNILPEFVTDPIVATVAGGFLNGVATGIIIKQAVANGPESIVGLYFKEKKDITVGTFFMILNAVIICSSILYGNVTMIVYSLICTYICSKVTDLVTIGTDRYYNVHIMSDRYLDITDFVSKQLKRNVTFVQGMDTSKVQKKILVETVVSKNELLQLKEYVRSLNDDSFVRVTESAGLIGKGYRNV